MKKENIKAEEIKLYRPSNGTEGMWFEEKFCLQCIHDDAASDKNCELITLVMCNYTTDPLYPNEWRYIDDKPTCTKWQKWDWGNDDDGRNEPPPPPPPEDPSQLLMPFGFSELFKGMEDVIVTKQAVTTGEILKELASCAYKQLTFNN